MNRRHFIELATGAALSRNASPPAQSTGEEAQPSFIGSRAGVGPFRQVDKGTRPHIFLISADMVSPDLYHPARPMSKLVKIPNIRSLMTEGSFFSNAFCTVPLCSPSRSSYLTGRYSYVTGNGERAPDGLDTQLRSNDIIFPEYLKASGYVCRQVGKSHVGTKKFLDAFGENDQPWDRWSPPIFDDEGFLDYQRRLRVKRQRYSREIVFKMQDRKTPGNSAGGWIVQQDGAPFPFEAHYTFYQVKRAIDTLHDCLQGEAARNQPIYLQLDIFDPHQPFSVPAGYEAREKELREAITLPESYTEARTRDFRRESNEPEIVDIYRKYWGLYDSQAVMDYRVAYILQMEVVDRAIGLLLDEIRRAGLYDNSMIVFISDHGESNGRRALVDKGVYLYPDVVRVPLVIKPARQVTSRIVEDPVSLLDLSRTVLDAAGIYPDAKFDGISLLPALGGGKVPERSPLLFWGGWHVGVNFACGIHHRTAEGADFLYSYNCTSAKDELYDLNAVDAKNLIDDPHYADVREHMIYLLGQELQRDPRWVGYWAEFRIAKYASLPKTAGDMQLFTKSS